MKIDAFAEYAAINAVNFSTLKHMKKSPLHYLEAVKTEREDTVRLAMGRGAHTAVLEPDRFPLDYVVFKGKRRQGKDWTAFESMHANDTILKANEYQQCLAIRDAVRRHPVAGKLFVGGFSEQAITWTDPDTKLKCKAKLDWFTDLVLADLKTAKTVDARAFGAQAARFDYHTQIAWYSDGLMYSRGIRPQIKLVAVELDKPHDVAVFPLSEDDYEAGRDTYRGWLEKVASCLESGEWTGRYPEEEELKLPAYVWGDNEEDQVLAARVVDEEEAA